MNANELADGILAIEERIFLTKKEHQLFQNSATMLRQQQAEIEALKSHPVKELTDEEITEIYKKVYEEGHENQVVALAKELLRKAQE